MRGQVAANAAPVDGFGNEVRFEMSLQDRIVPPFGVTPVFSHCRDASEPHFKTHTKFIFRQIAFESRAFATLRIQDEDGRRPEHVEAMKALRIFVEMNFQRHESFVDESGEFGIRVRLGFQPSTSFSGGGRAEIDEKRFALLFGKSHRSLDVSDPINGHMMILPVKFGSSYQTAANLICYFDNRSTQSAYCVMKSRRNFSVDAAIAPFSSNTVDTFPM